ncbi:hypothetical protein DFQ04_2252 [Algoriphagus boseongensis]|uniref:Small multi-drug export protein n=1 Tax=Algoriphagus boseongensis TaxID=1442587 RepID=A0A4R6T7N6_9BACT|nr:hypothetical protein [Algoriphagus boseongensis]TDQ17596.1 hypothetical protein DFQ04_2252 [Algoriphagus boseongensis]
MSESLITFFGIYFLSLFKFIAGPVFGYAAGFPVWKMVLVTVSGMMTSVLLFTLIGTEIKKLVERKWLKNRPVFTKRSRNIVKIWHKYGEIGIAFLTPLVLTPIGGTLVLVSFGTKKRRIYFHMLWSGLFWAFVFSLTIDKILSIPFFEKLIG